MQEQRIFFLFYIPLNHHSFPTDALPIESEERRVGKI